MGVFLSANNGEVVVYEGNNPNNKFFKIGKDGAITTTGTVTNSGAVTNSSTLVQTGATTMAGAVSISGVPTLSNAVIIMSNLPTSDPASAGYLWANSSVLTVSAGG